MKLSASNDVRMIFQGNVEERNWKFPHFKILLSLTCLHTNALKFYSLLLNFINFTILYGNCKEIFSWRETYGEFTYVLRLLTKYSWWIHQPPSASIILHLWFKLLLAIVILWTLDTCDFYVEQSSMSRAHRKQKRRLTMGMSFHKEGECRSIPAKPTGIKKEKDIPRLPEKQKKLYQYFRRFHFHSDNKIAVIYHCFYM